MHRSVSLVAQTLPRIGAAAASSRYDRALIFSFVGDIGFLDELRRLSRRLREEFYYDVEADLL